MNRRKFTTTVASCLFAGSRGSAASAPAPIIELRRYYLVFGKQMDRMNEFLANTYMPAARRAGIGPMGCFASEIARDNPFVVCVASHPSLGAMETALAKMDGDQEYRKASERFYSLPDLGHIRLESSLLRGFDAAPNITVPAPDPKHPSRVFELRCYQSDSFTATRQKVHDFNENQIPMFRRLGIRSVFFGETFVGGNMPNLTYMVMFDDIAARNKAWDVSFSDPEWTEKLSKTKAPDGGMLVAHYSNEILSALPFSQIK